MLPDRCCFCLELEDDEGGIDLVLFHKDRYSHASHLRCSRAYHMSKLKSHSSHNLEGSPLCPICISTADGPLGRTMDFEHLLESVVRNREYSTLQPILENNKELLWSVDGALFACLEGFQTVPEDTVKTLLDSGRVTPEYGLTFAYGFYVINGNKDMVSYLAEKGARPKSEFLVPYIARSKALLNHAFPGQNWVGEFQSFIPSLLEIVENGTPDVLFAYLHPYSSKQDSVFFWASLFGTTVHDNTALIRAVLGQYSKAKGFVKKNLSVLIILCFHYDAPKSKELYLKFLKRKHHFEIAVYAVMYHDLEALDFVSGLNFDFRQKNNFILQAAAIMGQADIVQKLVSENCCDGCAGGCLAQRIMVFAQEHGPILPWIEGTAMVRLPLTEFFSKPDVEVFRKVKQYSDQFEDFLSSD